MNCWEKLFLDWISRQRITQRRSKERKTSRRECCLRTQEILGTKVTRKCWKFKENRKIFQIFKFWNDICTLGRPLHKVFNDIGLDRIGGQKRFLKFYANICTKFLTNKILSVSSSQISKILPKTITSKDFTQENIESQSRVQVTDSQKITLLPDGEKHQESCSTH